jgi:hypothetical protein
MSDHRMVTMDNRKQLVTILYLSHTKITQSKLIKSKFLKIGKSTTENGRSPIDKALPSWLIKKFLV